MGVRRVTAALLLLVTAACRARHPAAAPDANASPAAAPTPAVPRNAGTTVVSFPAGDGPGMVGVVPPDPGRQADGPEAIAIDAHGAIHVLDKLNDRILTYDPATKRTSGQALDPSATALDLVAVGDELWTWAGGPRRVSPDARAARAAPDARTGSLLSSLFGQSAVIPRAPAPRRASVPRPAPPRRVVRTAAGAVLDVRVDRATRQVTVGNGNRAMNPGGERTLRVPSTHPLGNVDVLAIDDAGRSYVLVEELLPATGGGPPVRTAVIQYDASGAAVRRYVLPTADAVFVPRRPVAVGHDGAVYFLLVMEKEAVVLRLDGAPMDAEEPLGAANTPVAAPEDDAAFEAFVRSMTPAPRRAAPVRVTRADVLARARGFLDVSWTPTAANLGRDGARCDPPDPQSRWKRPPRLDGQAGVATLVVPYRWGGCESVEQFRHDAAAGKVTGDVCTCRDPSFGFCITPNAAGVDCSGFVSQAWALDYHTTRSLMDAATRLADFTALRPGDAIDFAGSHVRLVESVDPDAVTVIESTTAKQCQGVCRQTYHFNEIQRYVPIRRNGIVEAP